MSAADDLRARFQGERRSNQLEVKLKVRGAKLSAKSFHLFPTPLSWSFHLFIWFWTIASESDLGWNDTVSPKRVIKRLLCKYRGFMLFLLFFFKQLAVSLKVKLEGLCQCLPSMEIN